MVVFILLCNHEQQVTNANGQSFKKEIQIMNSYDEAVKSALEKVFESIALTGNPTPEQIKFIEMYKTKPKQRTLDDDIKTAEKVFTLVFGTDLGGKK